MPFLNGANHIAPAQLEEIFDSVEIYPIANKEGRTIGYYAKGFWNFESVKKAVSQEYCCDREGYQHGYFRFIPSPDYEGMAIKLDKKSKQGNFPVTYIMCQ